MRSFRGCSRASLVSSSGVVPWVTSLSGVARPDSARVMLQTLGSLPPALYRRARPTSVFHGRIKSIGEILSSLMSTSGCPSELVSCWAGYSRRFQSSLPQRGPPYRNRGSYEQHQRPQIPRYVYYLSMCRPSCFSACFAARGGGDADVLQWLSYHQSQSLWRAASFGSRISSRYLYCLSFSDCQVSPLSSLF